MYVYMFKKRLKWLNVNIGFLYLRVIKVILYNERYLKIKIFVVERVFKDINNFYLWMKLIFIGWFM